MKIPKRFKQYGITYSVEQVDNLVDTENYEGMAQLRKNKVFLQKLNDGYYRPQANIEKTFLHELVHIILAGMCENELSANEDFVDRFACLLHQAITTMEYK